MLNSIKLAALLLLLSAMLVCSPAVVAQDFIDQASNQDSEAPFAGPFGPFAKFGNSERRQARRQMRESIRIEQIGEESLIGIPQKTFSLFGAWSFPDLNQNFGWSYYPSSILQEGYSVGFAAGRRWSPSLRTELEFSYRRNEMSRRYSYFFSPMIVPASGYLLPYGSSVEGEMHTYSGFANVYYDFDRPANRRLIPYIGAGLGVSYFDSDFSYRRNGETVSNESAVAFQAMGGVTVRISRALDFVVEYRFFKSFDQEFTIPARQTDFGSFDETTTEYSLTQSELIMGIRFKF